MQERTYQNQTANFTDELWLWPELTYCVSQGTVKHPHERWAILLQFCCKFSYLSAKNYQNRSRFDNVTAKIKGCIFFVPHCGRVISSDEICQELQQFLYWCDTLLGWTQRLTDKDSDGLVTLDIWGITSATHNHVTAVDSALSRRHWPYSYLTHGLWTSSGMEHNACCCVWWVADETIVDQVLVIQQLIVSVPRHLNETVDWLDQQRAVKPQSSAGKHRLYFICVYCIHKATLYTPLTSQ